MVEEKVVGPNSKVSLKTNTFYIHTIEERTRDTERDRDRKKERMKKIMLITTKLTIICENDF